jgi:hypothetical protein
VIDYFCKLNELGKNWGNLEINAKNEKDQLQGQSGFCNTKYFWILKFDILNIHATAPAVEQCQLNIYIIRDC